MTRKYKITGVGTGYVGMSMAAHLGQHNEVIALDIDSARVALINQGPATSNLWYLLPCHEGGLR